MKKISITLSEAHEKVSLIFQETSKRIIGQERLIRNILVSILSGGHMILEGVPGLAKTLAVETISRTLDLDSSRISFTPDLLPSDLIGGEIYHQSEGKFHTKKGPIFTNFLLADEINRAPAKVQSALLEAMQERQVTIAEETYKLPVPFIVLATQNPIEQEGTYRLPEAQLDRFLLKTVVGYPTKEEEILIMKNMSATDLPEVARVCSKAEVSAIQEMIAESVYVDDRIYRYVRDIVFATRDPETEGVFDIARFISFGASPRASIALVKTAKTLAFLAGREYVIPEDIKELAPDVLRHRIGLSFEAIGEGMDADGVIQSILESVIVP